MVQTFRYFLLFLIAITTTQAQTPTILWETFFGNSNPNLETIHSISYNSYRKEFLVAAGKETFFGSQPTLIKTDSIGNLLWRRSYTDTLGIGTFIHSSFNDDGTVYLVGTEMGKGLAPNTYWREMILHLDSLGNIIWQYDFYGNINYPSARRIINLKNGYLLVSGDVPNVASNSRDFFAMLMTTEGNVVWERKYPFAGTETFGEILVEPDGSFMICGRRNVAGGTNPFFLKIDVNGDTIKSHTYPTASGSEVTLDAAKMPDNGYVISGYRMINSSIRRSYLAKLDSNLNQVWTKEGINNSAGAFVLPFKNNSVFTLRGLPSNYSYQIVNNLGNTVASLPYTPYSGPNSCVFTEKSHILIGGSIDIPNVTQGQDFYIAKIGNVGESYDVLRDICSLSPPKAAVSIVNGSAGFTFNNTSYSGLLYNEYMRYHWDFGDGTTDTIDSPTHNFGGSTNADTFVVTLVITNFYGCKDTLYTGVNSTISSLKNTQKEPAFNFSIYPNPAKEEVNIKLTTLPTTKTINGTLFNLQGKQLKTFVLQGEQTTISLRGLPAGMYIIQLQTEQGSVSKKLVKE